MPPVSRKRRPAAPSNGQADPAAGATRRARGAERDAAVRAELRPLAPGERPPALTAAIVVAFALAAAVLVGAATIHDLSRRGGSLPGALFLATVLVMLATGMARHRYWALLGFEALLAFQVLVTSIALVVASTVFAALVCVVSICLGGWLFWKLVRVMARMQAPPGRAEPPA